MTKQNEKIGDSWVDKNLRNEPILNSSELLIHTKNLPQRLQRLALLPWFECWLQQLRTEKKSEHTIRAYVVAAKTFTMTSLPNEVQSKSESGPPTFRNHNNTHAYARFTAMYLAHYRMN